MSRMRSAVGDAAAQSEGLITKFSRRAWIGVSSLQLGASLIGSRAQRITVVPDYDGWFASSFSRKQTAAYYWSQSGRAAGVGRHSRSFGRMQSNLRWSGP